MFDFDVEPSEEDGLRIVFFLLLDGKRQLLFERALSIHEAKRMFLTMKAGLDFIKHSQEEDNMQRFERLVEGVRL